MYNIVDFIKYLVFKYLVFTIAKLSYLAMVIILLQLNIFLNNILII